MTNCEMGLHGDYNIKLLSDLSDRPRAIWPELVLEKTGSPTPYRIAYPVKSGRVADPVKPSRIAFAVTPSRVADPVIIDVDDPFALLYWRNQVGLYTRSLGVQSRVNCRD